MPLTIDAAARPKISIVIYSPLKGYLVVQSNSVRANRVLIGCQDQVAYSEKSNHYPTLRSRSVLKYLVSIQFHSFVWKVNRLLFV